MNNKTMFHSDSGKFPAPKTWEQRIRRAASYAACAHEHPIYEIKATDAPVSAYSLAFLDALGKPQLLGMDIRHWNGDIGQHIFIRVTDTIHVLQVRVMIGEHVQSDTVLESGYAYPSQLDPSIWTYVTKTRIHQKPGFCVHIIADNFCGHIGVHTMQFN